MIMFIAEMKLPKTRIGEELLVISGVRKWNVTVYKSDCFSWSSLEPYTKVVERFE